MPTPATTFRTIALASCVALYANGAHAQGTEAPAQAPTASPQVMIVVEQPAPMVVAPPPVQAEAHLAPKPKEEEEWYGYQTLIVDGASLGLMLGGGALAARSSGSAGGTIALTGAVGYVLGGPIVHWMHGAVGPGFGSLGLRVGMPLAGLFWGAVIGAAADSGRGDGAGTGAAIGFVGGIAGAIIFDAALLGYEKPSEREKEAYVAAQAKHPIRWLPSLSPQKAGATVGVSGLFF